VTDKNARCILHSKNSLRGSNVVVEGGFRFLDDADVVAILDQDVVNALSARTIRPGTVNQNNIPNATTLVLWIAHFAAPFLLDSFAHMATLVFQKAPTVSGGEN
jgi:hypothetical protein